MLATRPPSARSGSPARRPLPLLSCLCTALRCGSGPSPAPDVHCSFAWCTIRTPCTPCATPPPATPAPLTTHITHTTRTTARITLTLPWYCPHRPPSLPGYCRGSVRGTLYGTPICRPSLDVRCFPLFALPLQHPLPRSDANCHIPVLLSTSPLPIPPPGIMH